MQRDLTIINHESEHEAKLIICSEVDGDITIYLTDTKDEQDNKSISLTFKDAQMISSFLKLLSK